MIVPTASTACTSLGQAFARLLDFYLSENKDHWAEIQKIAHHDTPEAFEKPPTPAFGVLRAVNIENATVVDGERQIPVKKGDTIFADFVTANTRWRSNLTAPIAPIFTKDMWGHVSRSTYRHDFMVQLGAFARLKNLRRAPGPAGQLKATTVNGAFPVYMNEDWSEWTPFPANMKVQFDGF
ncbi:uncharacterized protein N7446_011754 [Penicillium canescens]|uniref:Uncharacterized protein n=1 Tax=Penicillium canescens TaxID=5083 RepID=A0AAD6IG52_PENCN|nr:uncharacterized protein N7446_011754 [Penicillium canescens]KAJ6028906.1 hypothetical protein N7444_011893 [Penicillium canescens]KAJ6047340.1 hypothetical protein N7460_003487 [Penicillium canescens]KAJ6049071.1 hypothetical protein N7446_011754 [Penicillium canescens]